MDMKQPAERPICETVSFCYGFLKLIHPRRYVFRLWRCYESRDHTDKRNHQSRQEREDDVEGGKARERDVHEELTTLK